MIFKAMKSKKLKDGRYSFVTSEKTADGGYVFVYESPVRRHQKKYLGYSYTEAERLFNKEIRGMKVK
jgi:hypothetical protein